MKKLLLAGFILFHHAFAQQPRVDVLVKKVYDSKVTAINKYEPDKKANLSNEEYKKIEEPSKEEQELLNIGLELLQSEIAKMKAERDQWEKEHNIQVIKHPANDLDPLFAGLPQPIIPLSQAWEADKVKFDQTIYYAYLEKLKQYRERLVQQYKQHNHDQANDQMISDYNQKASKTQNDLEKNPVIQQMGGMEAIKNMTPEQRAKMVAEMQKKMQNNQAAFSGQGNDPQKAFTQKLMSDPGYRAKYEHMNDHQKQEEYKSFLEKNGYGKSASDDQKKVESDMKDKNKTQEDMLIAKRVSQLMNDIKTWYEKAGVMQKRVQEYYAQLKDAIDKQHEQQVAAVPNEVKGEIRDKNTFVVDKAYNIMLYKDFASPYAVAQKEIWNQYKQGLQLSEQEFNDFIDKYFADKKKASNSNTDVYNEQMNAGIHVILTELEKLTQWARSLTHEGATEEKSYRASVLGLYD